MGNYIKNSYERFNSIYEGYINNKNFIEIGGYNNLCPIINCIIAKINGAKICVCVDTYLINNYDKYKNDVDACLNLFEIDIEKYKLKNTILTNEQILFNLFTLKNTLINNDINKWQIENNIHYINLSNESKRYVSEYTKLLDIELLNNIKFDVCYSISTLEHINPFDAYLKNDLDLIMTYNSEMCHIIDISDHRIHMYKPDDINFGDVCEFSFMTKFNDESSNENKFKIVNHEGIFGNNRLCDYLHIFNNNNYFEHKIIEYKIKNPFYPKYINNKFKNYSLDELENYQIELYLIKNNKSNNIIKIYIYNESMYVNAFINKYKDLIK